MTWSTKDALEHRKTALRFLLDDSENRFTRSIEWRPQTGTNIPLGVWTKLYDQNLIDWYTPGGNCFRLTTPGWIEACRFLRDEVHLNQRFGVLSAHLKSLTLKRTESFALTSTLEVADATGLPELWVSDAVEGHLAENIYGKHGAERADPMGGIEVPAHFGNPL